MTSEDRFAKALAEGFANAAVKKRIAELNGPSFVIGDGNAISRGDRVVIPKAMGGVRAGQVGRVVSLFPDGLGLRFDQKVSGVTREFFEWEEITGASVLSVSRTRKRDTITPPRA
jgi:hypothetical protein